MQKKIILFVVSVAVILFGFLIYRHKAVTPISTIQLVKPIINVGASLPLSGPSASIGERVKTGFNIAVEEVNKEYPFTIKLIYEDDKGNSTTAVSVANKLISVDGVKIIVGEVKSDPLLAIAPITEVNKILVFSATAGAESISQAGDYVFRNIEKPIAHGEGMADFLVSKNIKKIAIFSAQASNAKGYAKHLREQFEKRAGVIVYSVDYNQDQTDFRTEIAQTKQAGAEAIYIGVATAKDAALVTKQARELKFVGLITVSVAADAKEFIDIAGSSAEGVVITAAPFDKDNPSNLDYATKYKTLTGSDSDGFAANGYDAIKLIGLAISNCNNTDNNTACLRDYLYGVKDYKGAGGTLIFDSNGDVLKPVMLKIVREGKFVKY